MGSRSSVDIAYIAGFLDGDGSIMLQVKRRADVKSGYRFMATICLYQDSRHDEHLYWMRDALQAGYISLRNDGMTEYRIQGFTAVERVLSELQPYIRFKAIQTEAAIAACRLLIAKRSKLSHEDLLIMVRLILTIQSQNYKSAHRKSEQELRKTLGLTP